MDQTFIALELAYEERGQVEGELEQVKQEIEDLAREAESDVLTLITDAMSAAEQLEKSGPLDFAKFQAGFGDMGDLPFCILDCAATIVGILAVKFMAF